MQESNQKRAARLLKPYRKQIDALDNRILKLLGQRFAIVRKVAKIKTEHNLPSFMYGRVMEVREKSVKLAKNYGIDPRFIYHLYSSIIYYSCAVEDAIKAKQKKK
ncbi:MAG: chorismate mutase [Proteobacteria bacterium]|nr:chorismate mutase [Pseudomonadota bacterium]